MPWKTGRSNVGRIWDLMDTQRHFKGTVESTAGIVFAVDMTASVCGF